jgi:hypothetical protein
LQTSEVFKPRGNEVHHCDQMWGVKNEVFFLQIKQNAKVVFLKNGFSATCKSGQCFAKVLPPR